MVRSHPYFIIPDLVIPEDMIENVFDQFSSQLDAPDGKVTTSQLGSAFGFVLTFVRDAYKTHFHERDKQFASTTQDLTIQLAIRDAQLAARDAQFATELATRDAQFGTELATRDAQFATELAARDAQFATELAARDAQLRQLAMEKQRVDQKLDYRKATVTRLKLELVEARNERTKAETLTTTTKAHNETTSTLLKKAEVQLVHQGKVIDRLLINGLSRLLSDNDDPLSGSISKSTLWQTQQNVPGNEFSVPLRRLQLPPHPNPAAIQDKCQDLQSISYPKEPPMYEPFTEFLQDYLRDTEFLVFNTNQTYYLDGLAPDITISLPGVHSADAMAMVLFFELKAQDGKVLGCDHNLGQVYEYLLAAARCQRERVKFAGILSNFRQNIAIVLTRGQTRAYLTHYVGTNMNVILRFVTMVLENNDFQPPELGFSEAIGPMLSRLGHPSNSIVGQFALREWFPASVTVTPIPIPDRLITAGPEPARMAVKRPKYRTAAALNPEIDVLLLIRRLNGHPNLPHIVMLSQDHCEVGILPIGAPISPSTLSIPGIGRTIIDDILNALKFLHAQNIVHRDVRAANVILHGKTAILIDFDAAARRGVLTTYMGGCICTPQAVLDHPNDKYRPMPADDLLAVVLMVNSLLFPYAYRGFQSQNLSNERSEEHGRVVALWAALKTSAIWGPLVVAASLGELELLRHGLKQLMVML